MAGIFAHVDDDISKLRQLKREIEGVKTALKGINIKIDIDIKQGLEAQLKSLTDQYTLLANKVAENESKITNSINKINQATNKIVTEQKKTINLATNTKGETSGNDGNISSIQAQARAYSELESQIKSIIGTKEANLARLRDEDLAISRIQGLIKQLNKAQQDNGALTRGQSQYLEKLNGDLIAHKQVRADLLITIKQQTKLEQQAEGSMKQLSIQLGLMRTAYRELTETEKASPFGRELLESIKQADEAIKQMDYSIGNYQRNVGNYASGWNGLNMSIQQLAREMPSLAYGPQVFFSAISNNLPILADEIKRAKNEYNGLIASGQKATPVWRQLVSSLVSWQTALTVGITLLTVYGKDIVEWVQNLFTADKALDELKDKMKKQAEEVSDAFASSFSRMAGNLRASYDELKDKWAELDSEADKLKFIKKHENDIKDFGYAINSVRDAENLFVNNTDSVVASFEARARAMASSEAIAQTWTNYFKQLKENEEKEKNYKQVSVDDIIQQHSRSETYLTEEDLLDMGVDVYDEMHKENHRRRNEALKERQKADAEAKKIRDEEIKFYREANKKANKELAEFGITEGSVTITTSEEQAKKEAEAKAKALAEANAILFKLNADNAEQEVALNENTEERKLAEIELGFNKRKAEIAKQAEELKQLNKDAGTIGLNAEGLTTEQQNAIDKANNQNKANKGKQISDYQQEQKEELDAMLADVQTYQQRRTAIEEEYAKKRKALYVGGDESKGLREGVTQDNVNEVKRQENEALTALDSEVASRQESFQVWVNSIAEMGLWKLQELLKQAEDEVKKAGENATPEQRAKLATLTQATNKAQAEYNANPAKAKMGDWQKVSSSLKKVASASKELGAEFKEMGGDFGEVAGRILEDASDIANSTFTIIDGIKSLTTGSIEGMTATSKGASEAIKGVEKASVILAIITAAIQITMKIINLVKDLSDRDNNKIIESNQKKIDNLKDSYERLSETAEEAFGESKANAIAQMNRNLERQKALIEEQKRAEQEKKNADEEALAQYDDKLKEINDQIKENAKEAEEAIYGEGMQSAIERFAEAYADAISSGNNSWKSAKDFARTMVKQMMMQVIKDTVAGTKVIEQLREKLKALLVDGLTASELKQFEQEVKYGMEYIESQVGDWGGVMKAIGEDSNATKGTISSMTQEQNEKLDGRFLALQITGEDIRENVHIQTEQTSLLAMKAEEIRMLSSKQVNALDGIADQMALAYLELQDINTNTLNTANTLKMIESDIREVKNNTAKLV